MRSMPRRCLARDLLRYHVRRVRTVGGHGAPRETLRAMASPCGTGCPAICRLAHRPLQGRGSLSKVRRRAQGVQDGNLLCGRVLNPGPRHPTQAVGSTGHHQPLRPRVEGSSTLRYAVCAEDDQRRRPNDRPTTKPRTQPANDSNDLVRAHARDSRHGNGTIRRHASGEGPALYTQPGSPVRRRGRNISARTAGELKGRTGGKDDAALVAQSGTSRRLTRSLSRPWESVDNDRGLHRIGLRPSGPEWRGFAQGTI